MASIDSFIDKLLSLLNKRISSPSPIPPALILAGGLQRPGMSAMSIASKIISRQGEAGVVGGPLPDGSQNVAEAMEVIRIEEILNAIKNEAKIEVVINPGITVMTQGSNSGGPLVGIGTTTGIGTGTAIIR